jgi:hypothetical protein
MPRKIRFKQKRLYQLKIILISIVFVLVIVFGLLAVDYNKSSVYYGERRLELMQIKPVAQDIYEVSFLSKCFDLNLKYLKRGIQEVKSSFPF